MAILHAWPAVCTTRLGRTSMSCHHIHTVHTSYTYPVPVHKQKIIDDQITELRMLELGIIRIIRFPWAAPVVLVPKKNWESRLCIDYQALNKKTPLDGFPMPQVHEILESLHGARYFSSLDLQSGYWQGEMDRRSIPKTAFVTKNNQYELLRLPFGLKNNAARFQCLMNTVLREQLVLSTLRTS